MQRLTLDEERVQFHYNYCAQVYPGYGDPLPGTALKQFDDIMWLDMFPMRVLWGHPDAPDFINAYGPEYFDDALMNIEGQYITDRAPFDPNETPMPIYPQQAQQAQRGQKHDKKRALRHVLKQLSPERAKKVRQLVRERYPELLEDDRA